MRNLFEEEESVVEFKPLADKMRPKTLEDFFGQEEVVGKDSPIKQKI